MDIPSTPRSTIKIMAENGDDRNSLLWEKSWQKFFDLYVVFIRVCVESNFKKYNWKMSHEQLDDAISFVFRALIKLIPKYDVEKSRFHHYLRGIVRIVVLQIIRNSKNDRKNVSMDDLLGDMGDVFAIKEKGAISVIVSQADIMEELSIPADQLDSLCKEERDAALNAICAEIISIAQEMVSPRMAMIFQMRVIDGISADGVARELGISRSVVDNDKYKFMKILEEIASKEPYKSELAELLK